MNFWKNRWAKLLPAQPVTARTLARTWSESLIRKKWFGRCRNGVNRTC